MEVKKEDEEMEEVKPVKQAKMAKMAKMATLADQNAEPEGVEMVELDNNASTSEPPPHAPTRTLACSSLRSASLLDRGVESRERAG